MDLLADTPQTPTSSHCSRSITLKINYQSFSGILAQVIFMEPITRYFAATNLCLAFPPTENVSRCSGRSESDGERAIDNNLSR